MIDRWRVGGVAYYLSVRGLDPGRASGRAVSKPFLNAPLGNVTASSYLPRTHVTRSQSRHVAHLAVGPPKSTFQLSPIF